MEKLRAFTKKVLNANGPAQIVSYSFWGVLIAGMMWNFCPEHLPNAVLALWGGVSAGVLVVAVFGSKRALKGFLLADMAISGVVLAVYGMHDPHYVAQMVYNVAADGSFIKVEGDIEHGFTLAALVWMLLHSAYLANLIQRQQLEQERFNGKP